MTAKKDKAIASPGGRKITAKQKRFVDEYLIDLNATQAAIRAGYSARNADKIGYELLGKTVVSAYLDVRMAERSERTEITQDMVLRKWWDIANANPNDLMQYRRVCCRHCHGVDHAYQWINETEYNRACEEERKQAKKDDRAPALPSDAGGFGFTKANRPHPGCPNCFGEGHGYVHFNDTRDLTGPAALLYAGAKISKDGIEVKVHDQAKALENTARHLGMFKEQHEHTGKNGAPIEVANLTMEQYKQARHEMLDEDDC